MGVVGESKEEIDGYFIIYIYINIYKYIVNNNIIIVLTSILYNVKIFSNRAFRQKANGRSHLRERKVRALLGNFPLWMSHQQQHILGEGNRDELTGGDTPGKKKKESFVPS